MSKQILVSTVTFSDKTSGTPYDNYDNNTYFLTPNNINELKRVINFNADQLSTLISQISGVTSLNTLHGALSFKINNNKLDLNSDDSSTCCILSNIISSVNDIHSDDNQSITIYGKHILLDSDDHRYITSTLYTAVSSITTFIDTTNNDRGLSYTTIGQRFQPPI